MSFQQRYLKCFIIKIKRCILYITLLNLCVFLTMSSILPSSPQKAISVLFIVSAVIMCFSLHSSSLKTTLLTLVIVTHLSFCHITSSFTNKVRPLIFSNPDVMTCWKIFYFFIKYEILLRSTFTNFVISYSSIYFFSIGQKKKHSSLSLDDNFVLTYLVFSQAIIVGVLSTK